MSIKIRLGHVEDLASYTHLLQTTYETAYTNEKIGLTADCFSKAVFATKNTQQYLTSHLLNNDKQKTWVAEIEGKIVGAITVININDHQAELTGFYVLPRFQGQGIGKKLYKKALAFADNRDLILDIYTHNKKTIAMYHKWGWQLDESRGDNGIFSRHWPEWPAGLEAKSVYMKLLRRSPIK